MKITKDYLRQLIRENLEQTNSEEAAPAIPDFRKAKVLAVKLVKMLDNQEAQLLKTLLSSGQPDYLVLAVKLVKMLDNQEAQLLKTLLSSGQPDYLRSFVNAMSVAMAGKKQ